VRIIFAHVVFDTLVRTYFNIDADVSVVCATVLGVRVQLVQLSMLYMLVILGMYRDYRLTPCSIIHTCFTDLPVIVLLLIDMTIGA